MQTIHPLLVHFPVAMLSLYGILEIISGLPIIRKFDLTLTKLVLVIIGTLGGMLASASGETIEHSFKGLHNLVEMHGTWATLTNFLGIIIAALLLVSYFSSSIISRYPAGTIARITGIIGTGSRTHDYPGAVCHHQYHGNWRSGSSNRSWTTGGSDGDMDL